MLFLSLVLACGGKNVQPDPASYLGQWQDEGGAVTTIGGRDAAPEVLSIVDSDGEVFEVRGTSLEGWALTWDYHVPSTGYDVSIEVISMEGDLMCTRWENKNAQGEECYRRLK